MLTKDDLLAIKQLLQPIEIRLESVEDKLIRLDKKIDSVERRLQKSINRVADFVWDQDKRIENLEKPGKFRVM